jgi:hypothetical protein
MRALVASALLLLAGCQSASLPSAVDPTLAPPVATTSPSPVPSAACDPVDELFASMFVALSQGALENAGIAPEEFFTALAGNRELLERYLEALDIPVTDEWIDAAMSADLGQRLLKSQGQSPSAEGDGVVCD